MEKKSIVIGILGVLALSFTMFGAGWFFHSAPAAATYQPTPLRTNNFTFVKPLLVCDTNPQQAYPELDNLNTDLTDYINSQKKAGVITDASVFFIDFAKADKLDINHDDTFSPASLAKLAIMIAYLKMSEANPNLLTGTITYNTTTDFNAGQIIQPKVYAQYGKTYTIQELIDMMIEYSDNNSYYALTAAVNSLGNGTLDTIYKDLQIPALTANDPSNVDNTTTNDISYLFRILYNGTYLTPEVSEDALQILSQVDYKNGLAAGVPANVAVAHKFGQKDIVLENTNEIQEREFHDCGIIYNPSHPYFLCVMTKGSPTADYQKMQDAIKDISSTVWKYVNSNADSKN